jgi:hypothetical protein
MKIQVIYILTLIMALGIMACEDESPMAVEVNDLNEYVGNWTAVEKITLKSNGTGDTLELFETLKLMVEGTNSGKFEVLDIDQNVISEGTFSIVRSADSFPLLRLETLVPDTNDAYEKEVNGENVYYSYQSFNVREVSTNKLVLTDATSARDLIYYIYSK